MQIAREMVISPRNSRLGLTSLVKRVGMMDRPDSPEGELIKYKVSHPLFKIIFSSSFLTEITIILN